MAALGFGPTGLPPGLVPAPSAEPLERLLLRPVLMFLAAPSAPALPSLPVPRPSGLGTGAGGAAPSAGGYPWSIKKQ